MKKNTIILITVTVLLMAIAAYFLFKRGKEIVSEPAFDSPGVDYVNRKIWFNLNGKRSTFTFDNNGAGTVSGDYTVQITVDPNTSSTNPLPIKFDLYKSGMFVMNLKTI